MEESNIHDDYTSLEEAKKEEILNSLSSHLGSLCSKNDFNKVLNDLKKFLEKNSNITKPSNLNLSTVNDPKNDLSKNGQKIRKIQKREVSFTDIPYIIVVDEILSYIPDMYAYVNNPKKFQYFGYFKNDFSRKIFSIVKSHECRNKFILSINQNLQNNEQKFKLFVPLRQLKHLESYSHLTLNVRNVNFLCLESLYLKFEQKYVENDANTLFSIFVTDFLCLNTFKCLKSFKIFFEIGNKESDDFVCFKKCFKCFEKIERLIMFYSPHGDYSSAVQTEIFVHNKFENLKFLSLKRISMRNYKKWNVLKPLETLILEGINFVFNRELYDEEYHAVKIFKFQKNMLKKLKKLWIKGCFLNMHEILKMVNNFSLQSLVMICMSFYDFFVIKRFQNLKYCFFFNEELDDDMKCLKDLSQIKELNLSSMSSIGKKFQNLNQLEWGNLMKLTINSCTINDEFFQKNKFVNLEYLVIMECRNEELNGKKWFPLGKLKSLSLICCDINDDLFVEQNFISNLEELKINECEYICGKDWKPLKSMKKIEIIICENDIFSPSFFFQQQKLESLEILSIPFEFGDQIMKIFKERGGILYLKSVDDSLNIPFHEIKVAHRDCNIFSKNLTSIHDLLEDVDRKPSLNIGAFEEFTVVNEQIVSKLFSLKPPNLCIKILEKFKESTNILWRKNKDCLSCFYEIPDVYELHFDSHQI